MVSSSRVVKVYASPVLHLLLLLLLLLLSLLLCLERSGLLELELPVSGHRSCVVHVRGRGMSIVAAWPAGTRLLPPLSLLLCLESSNLLKAELRVGGHHGCVV